MLIRDTARTLVAYAWMERQLFEVTGRWSLECDDADLARALATQSYRHAWHAQLWEERVPLLHDLDPSGDDLAPSVVAMLEPLPREEEDMQGRLVVLAGSVLPAILAQYRSHAAAINDVSDGPVRRALELVVRDEEEELQLLDGLLVEKFPGRAAASGG